MRKRSFSLLLVLFAVSLVTVSPSNADILTYNYLGNPFTTLGIQPMGEYITASFVFEIPQDFTGSVTGGPSLVSWWLATEGLGGVKVTNLDSPNHTHQFQFSSGKIDSWFIDVVGGIPGVEEFEIFSLSNSTTAVDYILSGVRGSAYINNSPGVWSSPVPLPPTFWFLGSGLLGLIGLRRYRRS